MQAIPVLKNPISQPVYQAPQSGYQASVPVTVYRELAAELQSTQAKLSFFQLQNEQLSRQNQMLLQEFEAISQSTERIQAILTNSNLPDAKLSEVLSQIRSSSPSAGATDRSHNSSANQASNKGRQVDANPQSNAAKISPRKTAIHQTNNAIQEAISRAKQLANPVAGQPTEADHANQVGENFYADPSYRAFDVPTPHVVNMPKAKKPAKLEIREEISSRPLNTAVEDAEPAGLSGWVLTLTIATIILTSFGAGYLLMRPFVK